MDNARNILNRYWKQLILLQELNLYSRSTVRLYRSRRITKTEQICDKFIKFLYRKM